MLAVQNPTDGITRTSQRKFDPSNEVYACVLKREAPNLQSEMGWSCPPNDETCGDCIEGLLAIAEEYPDLEYGDMTIESGARFFGEQAYACWRICRVLRWDRETTQVLDTDLDEFFFQTKCAVNKRRCTCDRCSIPHPCTMQCSKCGVEACGMLIQLYSDRLLCRPCIVQNP